MGLAVLGLRPVDDPLLCVPLVDMKTGDLLNPLAGQHQDTDCAGVGWVDGGIRTFEPAIEAYEFVFVQPTGPDSLGLGWNARCRIVGQAETSGGRGPVIVLGLHSPAVGGMDVRPNVVGHGLLAPFVDRADGIDDLVGFRSEEHTSELQSLMRISYADFCLK